jgi:hypothetical protein
VPKKPLVSPLQAGTHEKQIRRRLFYGSNDIAFNIEIEITGIPAYEPEAGKGVAKILFGVLKVVLCSAEQIDTPSATFKRAKEANRKVERHIPMRRLSLQEACTRQDSA